MAKVEAIENGRHYWFSTTGVFLPRDHFQRIVPIAWDKIQELLSGRTKIMKNPYIGKDGQDYHSYADLQAANRNWFKQMYPKRADFYSSSDS